MFSDGADHYDYCPVYLLETEAKTFADTFNRLMASIDGPQRVIPDSYVVIAEQYLDSAFGKGGGDDPILKSYNGTETVFARPPALLERSAEFISGDDIDTLIAAFLARAAIEQQVREWGWWMFDDNPRISATVTLAEIRQHGELHLKKLAKTFERLSHATSGLVRNWRAPDLAAPKPVDDARAFVASKRPLIQLRLF